MKPASDILLEHLALELEYLEKRGSTTPDALVNGLITSLRALRLAPNPGPTGARGMTDEQHAAALANAFTAGYEAGLVAARIVGLDAG